MDKKHVVAIDPKGDHLIVEAAARKLFEIETDGTGQTLVIRLVTKGRWQANGQIGKTGPDGFTVWSLKHGKPHPEFCRTLTQAVDVCLRVFAAKRKKSKAQLA